MTEFEVGKRYKVIASDCCLEIQLDAVFVGWKDEDGEQGDEDTWKRTAIWIDAKAIVEYQPSAYQVKSSW